MRIEELDYNLPESLIAQEPINPRDAARLMVVDKEEKTISSSAFSCLPDFLQPGDLLIFNETKVFPARLFAEKESGGAVEVLFLSEREPFVWEVLIGGKARAGTKIFFQDELLGEVLSRASEETLIKIKKEKIELLTFLEEFGHVPLPPYIKRKDKKSDRGEYQTVFAKNTGSAAAPTASLHFTENLLTKLAETGIETAYITLHVGLGTFAPIKAAIVEDHPIHEEHYEIGVEAAEKINLAKSEGRRVIAIGTTVMRALESAIGEGKILAQRGSTSLFITPGFRFQIVNGLVTNFHTPRSSLLALVYAFGGKELIRSAYARAIEEKYRFFSYGDGMFIK